MNERERLLTVLSGGKADQTPWYGDLSWWYAAQQARNSLPDRYQDDSAPGEFYHSHFQLEPTVSKGYLRLHQDAGIGIKFFAPMLWRESFAAEVKFTSQSEDGSTLLRITTPVGSVDSVSQYLPESYTVAVKTHHVKSVDDLEVVRFLWENRTITPNYAPFVEIDQMWGAAGLPIALGPICTSALQTLITRWAGIETTVIIATENPTLFEETLSALQSADDPIFEAICESPARVVEFPDNIAGQLTGTAWLRRFVLPYWRKRVGQLHDAGKIVGVHNDGGVKAALPVIIEAGFDFVEAVTPAPVGDLSLDEIRAVCEGKIIVIGGLPGVYFSPNYSRDYFVDFVKRVLDTFPMSEGFVLGVADQVPPDGLFDRMCLVREMVNAR